MAWSTVDDGWVHKRRMTEFELALQHLCKGVLEPSSICFLVGSLQIAVGILI